MKLKPGFQIILFLLIYKSAEGQNIKIKIDSIKSLVSDINNTKDYQIKELSSNNGDFGRDYQTTDGGESLEGFYSGKDLKKIEMWVGLSNRIIITDFYLNNKSVIFIYCRIGKNCLVLK